METTAAEPAYDDDGVDRSLVRWFLSLSAAERLAFLDDAMKLAELVAPDDPTG